MKTPFKSKSQRQKIEDEPGAEQRFKGILRKALNTPPKRKEHKARRGGSSGRKP
jgi:hypothetical protein